MTGHAIEARVYAEDPGRGFLPTGGTVLGLAEPGGARGSRRLRTRRAARWSAATTTRCCRRSSRTPRTGAGAIRALDTALADTAVLGVTTNIEFLRFLLADPDVVAGDLDTGLLDRRMPDFRPAEPGDRELIAAAAYKWLRSWPDPVADLWAVPSGWRIGANGADHPSAAFRRAHRPRPSHRNPRGRDGRRRGRRISFAVSVSRR